MTADILDTIDGAIAGWETSSDAMRWSPDPVSRSGVDDCPVLTLLGASPELVALERCMREQLGVAMDNAWQREVLRWFYPPRPPQSPAAVRAQALEARRSRGTGPKGPRLDGRRT